MAVLLIHNVGHFVARHFISTPRMGYAISQKTPAMKMALIVNIVLVLATFALVILTPINPGWIPEFQIVSLPQCVSDLSVGILVNLGLIGLFSFWDTYSE